jgi:DNA-binding transcriptional LysR family regulator
VLEDWRPDPMPLSLYYPSKRDMPTACAPLVDLIRSRQRQSA